MRQITSDQCYYLKKLIEKLESVIAKLLAGRWGQKGNKKLYLSLGVTLMRVTSGGAHLRASATQLRRNVAKMATLTLSSLLRLRC